MYLSSQISSLRQWTTRLRLAMWEALATIAEAAVEEILDRQRPVAPAHPVGPVAADVTKKIF